MFPLSILSAKGAFDVLVRLSVDNARFKELNFIVKNTRTLTRRLGELEAAGLIEKVNEAYRINEAGFEALMKIYDVEVGSELNWINGGDFKKLRQDWLRIPLKRLVKIFFKEFGSELISIALYGSCVKETFKMGESDVDMLYIVEDGVRDLWSKELAVFKIFKSTYEYLAFDKWFGMKGFYGYPEITLTSLKRNHALSFQPIYLDMLFYRAILYDKNHFLNDIMMRLQSKLKALEAKRVTYSNGSWYWILKPNLKPGETLEIDLRRD